MGSGLFALCSISPGTELIRIDSPLTAVLDSARLADTCAGCYDSRRAPDAAGNPGELKACTRCRVVRYCGKVGPQTPLNQKVALC